MKDTLCSQSSNTAAFKQQRKARKEGMASAAAGDTLEK